MPIRNLLFLILSFFLCSASTLEAGQTRHRPWLALRGKGRNHQRPMDRAVRMQGGSKAVGNVVAEQALKYRGVHYKYGGISRDGIDCSGLVHRVYNDLRLKNLPHMSRALYRMGRPVKRGQLRRGDLVFFQDRSRKGISHVGIYVGKGKFVHAARRHLTVTTTPLSEPYYVTHYAGARRLY